MNASKYGLMSLASVALLVTACGGGLTKSTLDGTWATNCQSGISGAFASGNASSSTRELYTFFDAHDFTRTIELYTNGANCGTRAGIIEVRGTFNLLNVDGTSNDDSESNEKTMQMFINSVTATAGDGFAEQLNTAFNCIGTQWQDGQTVSVIAGGSLCPGGNFILPFNNGLSGQAIFYEDAELIDNRLTLSTNLNSTLNSGIDLSGQANPNQGLISPLGVGVFRTFRKQ